MPAYESHVERLIREATERGEFDNLPGKGKPLNLPENDDPNWWIKKKLEHDGLDPISALPPTLQLRKEGGGFPESLAGIRDERTVRQVLDDYNRRVKLDIMAPKFGPQVKVIAHTVDVEEVVRQWRELRKR
ncbi:DUF1992 domain-containing protein [Aldersonia kunmingensis]|uniref:DnaJ family domain-containing protein n=1 Tax=Aldersonia kunmingensis TaxID=408066 RepID=UPI000835CF84|nr:DUF1992 domain-containing protein [Aldersonia kunmingensis]